MLRSVIRGGPVEQEANGAPCNSTAGNGTPPTVGSSISRGATNHIVLDAAGLKLAASVSRAASAELGLVPGAQVLAVFKASAVRWRLVADEPMGTLDVGNTLR